MSQEIIFLEPMSLAKVFLLAFSLLHLVACGDDAEKQRDATLSALPAQQSAVDDLATVKLPDLTQQPITLRVASVFNPRFKSLSEDQLEKILSRSQTMVKQYFSIDVVFSDVETLPISELFNRLKASVIEQRKAEIVDINFISEKDRDVMQRSILKTLSNYSADKNKVIDYAQPYLLHAEIRQTDFTGLSHALLETLISRLEYWYQQSAEDGRSVIDSSGYNEWVWWDSMGYGELPYDIIITNQLVASAEYYGMDVHSSIRGGVTAGTTTYSRDGLFSTYLYIMVYPMLNDSDLLSMLRQDESYSETQIIDYSAALLTHELGHLLLHLGHPFGDKSCIMSPTTMLNYRDWYDGLDSKKCRSGSSQQMKPGAATLEYNRNW